MKPVDFRNATFEGLRGELEGLRRRVYAAWVTYGPGTTREIAEKAGIDLLTFRPRTTELVEAGLVRVAPGEQMEDGRWKMAKDGQQRTEGRGQRTAHEGGVRGHAAGGLGAVAADDGERADAVDLT